MSLVRRAGVLRLVVCGVEILHRNLCAPSMHLSSIIRESRGQCRLGVLPCCRLIGSEESASDDQATRSNFAIAPRFTPFQLHCNLMSPGGCSSCYNADCRYGACLCIAWAVVPRGWQFYAADDEERSLTTRVTNCFHRVHMCRASTHLHERRPPWLAHLLRVCGCPCIRPHVRFSAVEIILCSRGKSMRF